MKNFSGEFKVGIFVILCLAGLAYLTISTGKLDVKKDGYVVYVVFNEIAGLDKKAPVMLNGLEVGKVEDIKVLQSEDKTEIMLTLWIDSSVRIRDNAVVSIKTLGLMGEKYIQISAAQGKDFIKPSAIINGKPYMDLDALMEQAQVITTEIGGEVNKLVASLNGTVESNKDSVSSIVKNLEATSKNFEEFSDDIKRHPWKLLIKSKEKSDRK